MNELRGGGSRKVPRKSREEVPKRVRIRDADDQDTRQQKIDVKPTQLLKSIVPGSVWQCRPFRFQPSTFVSESERLHDKFIEPDVQKASLRDFMDDPTDPVVYGVTGSPDDVKAKYFAAFLAQSHIEKLGNEANVVWCTLYNFHGDDPLKDSFTGVKSRPTLLIVSNLTPGSTQFRLEKARDLVERFHNIPRIIVAAGEDPLSFLATRLYVPVNALAYFSSSLMKQRVEVV